MQGLGGIGNGSVRKSELAFDHILSCLQEELQKNRETGVETSSGQPPNLPHYPSALSPVRPPVQNQDLPKVAPTTLPAVLALTDL